MFINRYLNWVIIHKEHSIKQLDTIYQCFYETFIINYWLIQNKKNQKQWINLHQKNPQKQLKDSLKLIFYIFIVI